VTRAMILAAGLGTRMRPLTDLCAKPALPVRGLPVIGYLLELLAESGISEVIVNTHYLPETIERAVRSCTPKGVRVQFSHEKEPLGTGGGIRQAADFLMESDPCIVMAGDMLLDIDLKELVSRHQTNPCLATLVLREDSRASRFGSIGISETGDVRRIADDFDLGNETAAGVFVGVRVLSREFLATIPERNEFEDLRDWMLPTIADGAKLGAGSNRTGPIRAELYRSADCVWEPVGTPEEYLDVNLHESPLRFKNFAKISQDRGTQIREELVLGARVNIGTGAKLTRCVVWDDEVIPAGAVLKNGVFAGGRFMSCSPDTDNRDEATSVPDPH
jgi:mannose-1-phosphate guanylyltransferase